MDALTWCQQSTKIIHSKIVKDGITNADSVPWAWGKLLNYYELTTHGHKD